MIEDLFDILPSEPLVDVLGCSNSLMPQLMAFFDAEYLAYLKERASSTSPTVRPATRNSLLSAKEGRRNSKRPRESSEENERDEEGLYNRNAEEEELEEDKDTIFGLTGDCEPYPGAYEIACTTALTTLSLVRRLARLATHQRREPAAVGETLAPIGIHWWGGRHHGHVDRAEGFCFLNDVALAVQHLISIPLSTTPAAGDYSEEEEDADDREGDEESEEAEGSCGSSRLGSSPSSSDGEAKGYRKVLVVDLDVHHGNGCQKAFYYSDRVVCLSVHQHGDGLYPTDSGAAVEIGAGKGRGTKLNLPLPPGTGDEVFEPLFNELFSQTLDHFPDVDFIMVVCGADSLRGDPLGTFNLSIPCYVRTVSRILQANRPTVLVGGGGYNVWTTARLWTLLTALVIRRLELNRKPNDHSSVEEPAAEQLTDLYTEMVPAECEEFSRFGPDYSYSATPGSTHRFSFGEKGTPAAPSLARQFIWLHLCQSVPWLRPVSFEQ
jgi:acetoin utilization deacetylase AcuC-like enzyme